MNAWPNDPNGSLIPVLEASVEAAKQRHPSASGPIPGMILTTADRCDRCGAAAVYRVSKKQRADIVIGADTFLDFCMHHWRKSFPAMADNGWKVIGANPELAASMGGTPDGQHAT